MALIGSGEIVFHGVSDAEIIAAFQIKDKYRGSISFNEFLWQCGSAAGTHDNVIVRWSDAVGYRAAKELIALLSESRRPEPSSATRD